MQQPAFSVMSMDDSSAGWLTYCKAHINHVTVYSSTLGRTREIFENA